MWGLGKKSAEKPQKLVEIPREGARSEFRLSNALPMKYFEDLATEAGCAVMLCTVIMPRVPDVGGAPVLPGIQWVKSIGSNPKAVFEFFNNAEAIAIYVEDFAAECKKYYDRVHYVINRRDDDHEHDRQA